MSEKYFGKRPAVAAQHMSVVVFISGCFDMLHAGHVEFFQRAAALGDQLYVALGSDRTVYDLKGRPPANSEGLSRGALLHGAKRGLCTSGPDLQRLRLSRLRTRVARHPSRHLCGERGWQHTGQAQTGAEFGHRVRGATAHTSRRPPPPLYHGPAQNRPTALPHRPGRRLARPKLLSSNTILAPSSPSPSNPPSNPRSNSTNVAWRLPSGAWATSTRRTAMKLRGNRLPAEDPHKLAYMLFCCDNPPGTEDISGAQDTIGLVYPGLARCDYNGAYWPSNTFCCNRGVIIGGNKLQMTQLAQIAGQ
ncbi:MAG: adenylyltransferase/cytidyltransferase family protein [Chloroflexi bacterium]|nr:adenylyltransferase/cytidyltransferase family protein [Chloroflexota bacterium]